MRLPFRPSCLSDRFCVSLFCRLSLILNMFFSLLQLRANVCTIASMSVCVYVRRNHPPPVSPIRYILFLKNRKRRNPFPPSRFRMLQREIDSIENYGRSKTTIANRGIPPGIARLS